MRFADIRAGIPEYCPGTAPCRAVCTLDGRDGRILDPDCFRGREWQRLVDKTSQRESREKLHPVPNRAARRALRK